MFGSMSISVAVYSLSDSDLVSLEISGNKAPQKILLLCSGSSCLLLHVSKLGMTFSNALLISSFLCSAKLEIYNFVIPIRSV